MAKEYLGGAANEWHIHNVGSNPKISLGPGRNIRLDLNEESTKNWKQVQTAIEIIDKCHREGIKINPKKSVSQYDVLRKALVDYQNQFEEPRKAFNVQEMIDKVWKEDVDGIRTTGFFANHADPGFDRLVELIKNSY